MAELDIVFAYEKSVPGSLPKLKEYSFLCPPYHSALLKGEIEPLGWKSKNKFNIFPCTDEDSLKLLSWFKRKQTFALSKKWLLNVFHNITCLPSFYLLGRNWTTGGECRIWTQTFCRCRGVVNRRATHQFANFGFFIVASYWLLDHHGQLTNHVWFLSFVYIPILE